MHRTNRPHRLVIALAVAGVLGFTATRAVQAAPITGDGVPIDIEQPSLGVTYLVRTQDPTNIADVGQVVAFAEAEKTKRPVVVLVGDEYHGFNR